MTKLKCQTFHWVKEFTLGNNYGRGAKNWVPGQIVEQMSSVSFGVELNDGTVCHRDQDQIHKWHDPVDTAPMPKIVEPSDQNTSVPSATSRAAKFR